MSSFDGFSDSRSVNLPSSFFSQALPRIRDLYELKVLLAAFWLESSSEEEFFYFIPALMGRDIFSGQEEEFQHGLKLAVEHEWLLPPVRVETPDGVVEICFLNTARGKAGLEAVQRGEFRLKPAAQAFRPERPNIFILYEENIGVITPIIADALKDLEAAYPPDWIAEAVKTAVKNNARSLRYIEVVLQNWQEEGKDVGTNRRRHQTADEEYDPEGYTDGEFSDFIDH